MNIEQQLANVLAAHDEWRMSDGESGVQLDLSDAILYGVNLSGACLNHTDMRGAFLRNKNNCDQHGVER